MAALFSFLFIASSAFAVSSEVDAAFIKLSSLNTMREGLAAGLDIKKAPITGETFQQVCVPVGKALKEWGKEQEYSVRQTTEKYRNPLHAATTDEKEILKLFEADPKMVRHEVLKTEPVEGTQLYVRIPVVSSCLHCHGEAEKRPAFIKAKYENDKAFGFKAGDLRGLYSVFVPAKVPPKK